MPHPTDTKRYNGKIWHLEDQKLTLSEARALRKHLVRTENKKAIYNHTPSGYQVWWSK
jgi:hypothetical protein